MSRSASSARPLTVLADDGLPLHTEISGPDDAPVTIIFSHGYCLTQDCWHFQRQALATAPARLVFWDQRGHGRSGALPSGPAAAGRPPVSIGQLGADLGAVLAARPRRHPGPAGRALDGRDDDHGAGGPPPELSAPR